MTVCEVDISKDIPVTGLTTSFMNSIAEAAIVCFDDQNHDSGVTLRIEGELNESIIFQWSTEVSFQIKDTWNDLQEATEYGATYLAVLIIHYFTPLKVIKRSRKRTGFDYWLGEKEDENYPFQEKSRLEISGILQENKRNSVDKRVKEKLNQTKQSDNLNLPAYIVVVGFHQPQAQVAKK